VEKSKPYQAETSTKGQVPLKPETAAEDFQQFAEEVRKRFAAKGLKPADVEEAIKCAREQ